MRQRSRAWLYMLALVTGGEQLLGGSAKSLGEPCPRAHPRTLKPALETRDRFLREASSTRELPLRPASSVPEQVERTY